MTRSPLHKLSLKDGLDDSSLLRTLVDTLPEQVYVKDTEGRYVLNNLAHARALGTSSPEEIAGKSDSDFYPDELAERYRTDEQGVLRSGRPLIDKEEPSVDGEGNERRHLTTKVPVRNGNGQIVGLLGVSRDVTEQKEAEEELHGLQREYEELVDSVDAIIWKSDARPLRFTFVSHQAETILGYPVERWITEPSFWSDHIHPEDREWAVSFCQRAIEDKRSHTFEYRMIAAGGNVVWLRDIVHVAVEGGVPTQLFGVMIDITERKEAERKLRESEERFRTAFEDAPIGVALVGLDRRYLRVNRAYCQMLGYSEEELLEKPHPEIVHPDDREKSTVRIQGILEEGVEPYALERRYLHADGHVVWSLSNISLIRDSEGEPSHFVCLHQDITERKEAEEKLREREKRFRSLIQNASDVITILDEDGTICYESPAVEWVLGYRPEERIGRNAFDYVHPDDRERVEDTFAEALNDPGQVQRPVEFRLRHKGGSWRHMETTRTNLLEDPAVEGVVANSRDITGRRRAEEALRESEERFRSAFENAPIGVALVGLDGRRFRVNRAFCEMLGCPEEELLGTYLEDIHPDDREISTEHLCRVLEGEFDSYTLERRYLHADGHVVWNLSSVSLIRDSEGEPSHFVCLHQDITERKELEERLRHQAFYDSLTDLPNRPLFLDRLDHALARAGREGGQVAVLLVDLDDFKVVNDSLGHDAGNVVLAAVAERMRGAVRPGDTVGRIFGDEFAVLLEAPAGAEEAKWVAQRIEERLQEPFEAEGQEVFVKASIGITVGESGEDRPKEVLRHADLAMYEAKKHSKTQHEIYDPSMNTRAVERMNLERDLRRAVEREEFEVHYQPKVLLETGAITGVEALVRWRHPDRGLLLASQFIQLAEETGLINQIGLWVLKESCRQFKEWQEQYPAKLGPSFGVCVNLSAEQIRQPDLAEKVAGVLRETGLDPRCLMLEISERTAKEDAEQTIGKLRELKDLGVGLALDDFGTGYCSLVYLEHSLLDFLKIDRLLVHRKREDDPEGCAKVISVMTSMAHSLDLAVIVEGVETEDELAKLKEIGCEMVQGHYFAEPLPSEATERLLVEGVSW